MRKCCQVRQRHARLPGLTRNCQFSRDTVWFHARPSGLTRDCLVSRETIWFHARLPGLPAYIRTFHIHIHVRFHHPVTSILLDEACKQRIKQHHTSLVNTFECVSISQIVGVFRRCIFASWRVRSCAICIILEPVVAYKSLCTIRFQPLAGHQFAQ